MTQLFAHGRPSESEQSSTTGYHIIHLNVGWNLVSFPSLNPDVSPSSIFLDYLTRGDDIEGSDVIYGVDHENGGWKIAWRQTNGQWNGELRLDNLNRDEAYWVLIREGHDEIDLPVVGPPDTTMNISRGLYEAGDHLIGTMWPEPKYLRNAGLTDAGFIGFGGLHDRSGNLADMVIGYNSEEGFYTVAWHDGEIWRGDYSRFEAGHGYLLHINHAILWDRYSKPGWDVPEPENNSDVQIHHPIRSNSSNQSFDLPPMPYNLIQKKNQEVKLNQKGEK